jgi:hypothetical protein
MKDAFLELANGNFNSGFDKLNQDLWWHDDCFDVMQSCPRKTVLRYPH